MQDAGQTGPDFKAQAKLGVQKHAKSMKQGPQQSAPSCSGGSQHRVMLQSHRARLGAKDGAPATAPQ